MKLSDICTLVQQVTIPQPIQVEVIDLAKNYIKLGFDVEVVASMTSVILDVYDDEGVLQDRIKRKFSKQPPLKFTLKDLD